jgi:hypothetical protein
MDLEAPLSSAESSHRTEAIAHSLLAISIAFRSKKPRALAVATINSEGHYTEEGLTIPERLASQVAIAINNLVRAALNSTNPGQAGAASCVFVS